MYMYPHTYKVPNPRTSRRELRRPRVCPGADYSEVVHSAGLVIIIIIVIVVIVLTIVVVYTIIEWL